MLWRLLSFLFLVNWKLHFIDQNGSVFLIAVYALHAIIANLVGIQIAPVAFAAFDAHSIV